MLTIYSWGLKAQESDPIAFDSTNLIERWNHPGEYEEIANMWALGEWNSAAYTNDYLMFMALRVAIKQYALKGVMWTHYDIVMIDGFPAKSRHTETFDSDGRLENWPKTHFDLAGKLLRELL